MQNSLKSLPQGGRNHVFSKRTETENLCRHIGSDRTDRRGLYDLIGLYLMIAGAVILAVIAFSAIKEKQSYSKRH